jgi:hypothetical protein
MTDETVKVKALRGGLVHNGQRILKGMIFRVSKQAAARLEMLGDALALDAAERLPVRVRDAGRAVVTEALRFGAYETTSKRR